MERDEVNEFLKKMGMRDDQHPQENQWEQIIIPSSSYLVVGDVGTGKSALCFWLLETFSQKYNLQPVVVGFPWDKKELLPDNFLVLDEPDALTKVEGAIALIDEADIQLPIEDTKARKHVINFLSLPRHRDQIFLLSFHFPRLVLGRYLPFFSGFLLKRPPYLIEFAGKRQNDALTEMMRRAEERFNEVAPPNWQPTEEQLQPIEVMRHTYVVAPRIRWQGLLTNPLCTFWSKELSKAWSGTEIERQKSKEVDLFHYRHGLVATDGKTPITTEMRRRGILIEKIDMTPPNRIYLDPWTNLRWVE